MAENPGAVTPAQLKQLIVDSGSPKGWLAKKTAKGGRLDAAAALRAYVASLVPLGADAASGTLSIISSTGSKGLVARTGWCKRPANQEKCAVRCDATGACKWVRRPAVAQG